VQINITAQNMPTYTFTVSSTYALSTHEVSFTSTKITIKISSSGRVVFEKDFSAGIAFRCNGNDFQIGTLTANNYLSKSIDTSISTATLWLEEKSGANLLIGTDDPADDSIYHIFNINQCPVLLSRNGVKAVMKCPCEGSPCTNGCYQYGV